ncbi:MAG: hypothetical protein HY720_23815 [Planctomycetes bacterium]|nr:hypothetical protein [Planctomycetota bacterium]
MRLAVSFAAAVLLGLASTAALADQEEGAPSEEDLKAARWAFEQGNALMEEKKYAEALVKYREGLERTPEATGLLFNGGLAALLAGEPAAAAELFKRLKAIEPASWEVRTKLVQAFQAAGDRAARDAERAELFEFRRSSEEEAIRDAAFYCRDQFLVGTRRVYVLEYFELEGERALRYRFSVSREGEETEPEFYISLGSYESTTAVSRELGEIGPDERMFHLDGYFEGGTSHRTYGFFKKEPDYDAVREQVLGVLSGEIRAISGTDLAPSEKQEEKDEKAPKEGDGK